jgi:hypothetical protein
MQYWWGIQFGDFRGSTDFYRQSKRYISQYVLKLRNFSLTSEAIKSITEKSRNCDTVISSVPVVKVL